MRIIISFKEDEKVAIMNATETTTESTVIKGRFGEMSFDDNTNIIDIRFVEDFVLGIANLIGTIVGMTKSIINTFNIFESAWLKDVVVEHPDKQEESNEADESHNA